MDAETFNMIVAILVGLASLFGALFGLIKYIVSNEVKPLASNIDEIKRVLKRLDKNGHYKD